MTDPFSANEQEKSVLTPNQIQYYNNKHHMIVLYKRWKKYNEIQLINNKMTFKKIIQLTPFIHLFIILELN